MADANDPEQLKQACGLCAINQLRDIGVSSVKIVGRADVSVEVAQDISMIKNCFDLLKNKLGISLKHGDIVICTHGKEIERKHYNFENMSELPEKMHSELKELMKRSSYTFGQVMFYSDARLADLDEKRTKNMSL